MKQSMTCMTHLHGESSQPWRVLWQNARGVHPSNDFIKALNYPFFGVYLNMPGHSYNAITSVFSMVWSFRFFWAFIIDAKVLLGKSRIYYMAIGKTAFLAFTGFSRNTANFLRSKHGHFVPVCDKLLKYMGFIERQREDFFRTC